MCNLIAIIPTTPSALYNTFGLDFAVPAQYDPETGDCIVDADWLDWVEIGPFDPERPELTDPRDRAVRNRLDEAAQTAGYGLDWGTYRETTTWEFHEVDAYRLDQGEKPMTTTQIGTFDYSLVIEVAHHVEWYGHQSRASIVRKFGAGADDAIDAAVEMGLLREVPRLGGFTATRKVKSELFGDRYAAAWA